MDTKCDNCSHINFGDDNDTKRMFVIMNTTTYFPFTLAFIILFGIYWKQEVRRRTGKHKHFDSFQTYLGFSDLPAIRTRIPIKLIGIVFELFPLREAAEQLQNWSNKYGDIFTCIGLNQRFVVLNSGPTIQALMKSYDFGHAVKAPVMYDPMKPFITNGVLVAKGASWQKQRKLIMKTQSFVSLKSHIPMIERHSKQLVEDLDKLFEAGGGHQINDIISTTFIGIITEVITGKKINDPDELKEYHHNFTIWKEVVFKRIINPFLHLKPIWMFHSLYKPNENALKGLSDFAIRRLAEHKSATGIEKVADSGIKYNRTMLDELVDAGVEEKQIIDEINTMMFGGHETGACAIHFFCFCLALNPQIQLEAQKEVDELFQGKNGMLAYESIQANLKYLERCLLETLRLFPPVFMISRKLESPLMTEHKGKPVLIPKGVIIVLSPFALHRREELYPNAEKFDPDRFTTEESSKRHAYSFIPFSGGPRNCLGQKLAMIELKIIAAYILRHFELATTDKMEDIKLLPYTTITPEKDFTFVLKRRNV